MNKKIAGIGGILVIIIIGAAYLANNAAAPAGGAVSASAEETQESAAPTPVVASASSTTSAVPLMQSTGELFSQYKYASKAHELYPTLAADAKAALGAFSYTKEDLGNSMYRFTLTNDAEGYQGKSVVVGAGQSVYFIEPSTRDDSASEDSATTDDLLVAVDAQGYVLK